MKRVFKLFLVIMLFIIVSFIPGKQTYASAYKRLFTDTGQSSIKIGNITYIMEHDSGERYIVYKVKGTSKMVLLSNVSGMVVTDGNYMYYAVLSEMDGVSKRTSVMYKYTIATGKKKKLFKKNLYDGILEFGAVPCYVNKNYLYYGSHSQYGSSKLWSLYVFNTKTCKSRKIKISGLIDGESVKKSGNWINVSVIDHVFNKVEAKYKFKFSGEKLIKIE